MFIKIVWLFTNLLRNIPILPAFFLQPNSVTRELIDPTLTQAELYVNRKHQLEPRS